MITDKRIAGSGQIIYSYIFFLFTGNKKKQGKHKNEDALFHKRYSFKFTLQHPKKPGRKSQPDLKLLLTFFKVPGFCIFNRCNRVKWELPDVAHTFLKRPRVMIQIQSSWFPLADRNPQKFVDIYKADNTDFQKTEIRVYREAADASKIILPILRNP